MAPQLELTSNFALKEIVNIYKGNILVMNKGLTLV